ncbi:MAG: VTT domain-containing protein [Betaproteobacteria bacterium]|nr:VTT domain-containing protein [Betaproteobacteria bacterium]
MTNLLAQHGLTLVFVNVFLTQAGLPVPAIPVLVVAGAFVQQGELAMAGVLVTAVAASLLGDALWFVAGRRHGYRILRTLCRIAIEPDSCVKQTENIFERWGAPSLVVAKFIPGFATVAPPLAGTMRLDIGRFAGYSSAGALLWAAVPVVAGMFFHSEVEQALAWLVNTGTGALMLLAGIIAAYAGIKGLERYLLIRFLRMVRISVGELHDLMRSGAELVILDARSGMARRLDPRRIPGAVAVDINVPGISLAAVPPDHDVVVYCS